MLILVLVAGDLQARSSDTNKSASLDDLQKLRCVNLASAETRLGFDVDSIDVLTRSIVA